MHVFRLISNIESTFTKSYIFCVLKAVYRKGRRLFSCGAVQ